MPVNDRQNESLGHRETCAQNRLTVLQKLTVSQMAKLLRHHERRDTRLNLKQMLYGFTGIGSAQFLDEAIGFILRRPEIAAIRAEAARQDKATDGVQVETFGKLMADIPWLFAPHPTEPGVWYAMHNHPPRCNVKLAPAPGGTPDAETTDDGLRITAIWMSDRPENAGVIDGMKTRAIASWNHRVRTGGNVAKGA